MIIINLSFHKNKLGGQAPQLTMAATPMAVPKNSDYKYTGPAPPAGKRGIVSGPPPRK